MESIIKIIVESGIACMCVAYMIYFQNTTMRDMNKTLTAMTGTLQSISDRLEILEQAMMRRNKKDDKNV